MQQKIYRFLVASNLHISKEKKKVDNGMTHLQDKEKVQGPKGSDETFPFLHVSLSLCQISAVYQSGRKVMIDWWFPLFLLEHYIDLQLKLKILQRPPSTWH